MCTVDERDAGRTGCDLRGLLEGRHEVAVSSTERLARSQLQVGQERSEAYAEPICVGDLLAPKSADTSLGANPTGKAELKRCSYTGVFGR